MVIVNATTYNKIVEFLSSYRGLSIECEDEVQKQLPNLPADTIRSIISKHGQTSLKQLFYRFSSRADVIVAE